jgi:TolB-like protein/Tfp pilus assembly protein PilF
MVQKSNRFERFWKELKRRKVIHVITVYAAVAFVILQLVDIVERPLRLPDWTTAFVIVLLCVGFIIALFLSWVYDITPTGVKKTKSISTAKHTDQKVTPTSSGWKIATFTSIVIIVVLVVFNILSDRKQNGLEKSIAVLPFKLLSDEPDKQYLADGMMDAITLHLSKIKDLRVMSRTSVEQYRGTTKTTRIIGQELNVGYLLEGSFQKFGDNARLIVQLIKASEESHKWGNEFNSKWSDVFSLQSEVAQKIASELNAVISPEEKQIIEKIPTISMSAYNYYLRGKDELWKFGVGGLNRESVKKAEYLFKKAIENDSTFAQGYAGLGYVYWKKSFYEENYSKHFRDSMLAFANIALSYDDKLTDAYVIRAGYYAEVDFNLNNAIVELDKAIRFDPNNWEAYFEKGKYYWWEGDLVKEIENLQKAVSLNHDAQLPEILTWIGYSFISAGFPEEANYYYNEAFNLNNDSVSYLWQLAGVEFSQGNYNKSIELLEKINAIDSTSEGLDYWFAKNNMFAGQYNKSLKYVPKWVDILKASGAINNDDWLYIGFIYWVNGYKKEAEDYFDKQIAFSLDYIKKNGPDRDILGWYFDEHYSLAGVYAFRGDKEKAYKNLKIFNQRKNYNLLIVTLIKNDPLFNSIRNEPEFQQIVKDVEVKYQAQHERVKKWLEEQGMPK